MLPHAKTCREQAAALTSMLERLDAQQAAREQQGVVDMANTERQLRRRAVRREKRAMALAAADAEAEHGAIESIGFGTEALELILAMAGSVVRCRSPP